MERFPTTMGQKTYVVNVAKFPKWDSGFKMILKKKKKKSQLTYVWGFVS